MEKQIESLYQPLFLYVRKRINGQEDAEDLTQEIFYKLAKSNINQIKNIRHLVYSIAKNTIIDFYRKKKFQTNTLEDYGYFEDESEDKAIQELSLCVIEFIEELPEDYRKIMTMSELENMSQKEIASALDTNYITVRSKVQRGRKKLKDMFTKCCTVLQGGKGSIMDYKLKDNCNTNSC